MNKKLRKAVIAGNWKMNKTPQQAEQLVSEIVAALPDGCDCDVLVCPPFVCLERAVKAAQGSLVQVGAQNCHFKENGAFTGEISAPMLVAVGATHAIVGHSERRQYFGESDETVNLRLRAVLDAGLTAILCVGESLEQRESGETQRVCRGQLEAGLAEVTPEQMQRVIVAYEPIWAIGTGRTATAQQAEEVCAYLRGVVAELYSVQCAQGLTIQYGGSMNAGNAQQLLACENIDGGLIGGASLKAEDFAAIVCAASKADS